MAQPPPAVSPPKADRRSTALEESPQETPPTYIRRVRVRQFLGNRLGLTPNTVLIPVEAVRVGGQYTKAVIDDFRAIKIRGR